MLFRFRTRLNTELANLIYFWAVGENQGPLTQPFTYPRVGTTGLDRKIFESRSFELRRPKIVIASINLKFSNHI
jgi:hypothetical protein